MPVTPESTPDQIKEMLKDVDPKDRNKIRELTANATPKQSFEVILPFMFTKSPEAQNKLKGVAAAFQFVITGDGGGDWQLLVNNGGLDVKAGKHEKPNCTITMARTDWGQIQTGKLDPQAAFMAGKIKFQGDMNLIMKLGALLRPS